MCTTGTLYTSLTMIANRYRPTPITPMYLWTAEQRAAPGILLCSASLGCSYIYFFMVSVYTHYHPNMKHKWVLYTVARAGAANTGLLRLAAKLSLVPNFKDGASGFTAYYKLGKN